MKRSFQHRTRGRRRQRGIALILCLFALLLLSSIALGLVFMADTETVINGNFRSSQQAYFAANAGLEEARSRLTPDLAGGIPTPTYMPGYGPGSLVYIIDRKSTSEIVEPWNPDPTNAYYDTELCHENYGRYGLPGLPDPTFDVPCGLATIPSGWLPVDSTDPYINTTRALNFKWVRINLKMNASGAHGGIDPATGGLYVNPDGNKDTQVCWDGSQEMLLPAGYGAPPQQSCDKPSASAGVIYEPVVILTALAQGSRRITQMEVAQNPPIITNAAVDSKDHVSLRGNLGVNGYDFCSCEQSKDPTTGIVTYKDRPGTGKTCDATKWAIYTMGDITQAGGASEAIVAGPNPPMVANQKVWPYDIPKMVQSYVESPGTIDVTKSSLYQDWTDWPNQCKPSGSPNIPADCGTYSGGVFGVPPDFPPSPVDNPKGPDNMAQQITYVPGSVALHGDAVGNGVLVIDGDLEIDGGLQFYGLILVSGVLKFKGGGSEKTNIYGAVLAGERSIDEIDTTLGGGFNIQYDYCALKDGRKPQPPTVISFRELTY